MNALTTTAPVKLPTAADNAPTLTSTGLHSRLLADVPHRLVSQGRFTSEDLPALRSYQAEAARLAVPASPEQIMHHVGRLSLHYPQPDLPEQANASRWEDWFEDFSDVPPDLLMAACAAWRRSDARFAPSPGQLLAKVDGWGKWRPKFLEQASEVIRLLEAA